MALRTTPARSPSPTRRSARARALIPGGARTSTLPLAEMAVRSTSDRRQRPLSQRLDREWYHLCRRPGVLATVRSWGIIAADEPPLASLDDLLYRCGHHGAGTPPAKATPARVDPRAANERLGRVVTLAATEPLAARIVLQRIMPGLLAIVRSEQSRSRGVDAFDQIIGEAWLAITNYRVERRGSDIAAQLLHDARHRAFTHPRRRRSWHERPGRVPVTASAAPAERSSFEDLIEVLADARRNRQMSDAQLAVIRGIVRHGNATRYAEHDGLNARTVRSHRDRAVVALRRAVSVA